MTEIQGLPIYFDLTEQSREIFESIIISRFSVRDDHDEVLRTDGGLAFVERGTTSWKLVLAETEVLVDATGRPEEEPAGSDQPDMVTVKAAWHRPDAARNAGVDVQAGGNANVFYGMGAVLVPGGF